MFQKVRYFGEIFFIFYCKSSTISAYKPALNIHRDRISFGKTGCTRRGQIQLPYSRPIYFRISIFATDTEKCSDISKYRITPNVCASLYWCNTTLILPSESSIKRLMQTRWYFIYLRRSTSHSNYTYYVSH